MCVTFGMFTLYTIKASKVLILLYVYFISTPCSPAVLPALEMPRSIESRKPIQSFRPYKNGKNLKWFKRNKA
jgi:hypothetical protein